MVLANVRDYPEKHGLHIIAELEFGEYYEFDTHIALKHEDGRVFYCHDAGCSCPHPFEDYNEISSLDPITKDNFALFQSSMLNLKKNMTDVLGFIQDVRKAVFE